MHNCSVSTAVLQLSMGEVHSFLWVVLTWGDACLLRINCQVQEHILSTLQEGLETVKVHSCKAMRMA